MRKILSNYQNIFIIGPTKSGKTTTAKKIAVALGYQEKSVVSMSEFFRKSFENKDIYSDISRDDISEFSTKILKYDINVNLEYVKQKTDNLQLPHYIYEGFRNPYEFMKMFDAEKDFLIILRPDFQQPLYASEFERLGLMTISKNILWLREMVGFSNFDSIHYSSFDELNRHIDLY